MTFMTSTNEWSDMQRLDTRQKTQFMSAHWLHILNVLVYVNMLKVEVLSPSGVV